jgi:hypothetical protein
MSAKSVLCLGVGLLGVAVVAGACGGGVSLGNVASTGAGEDGGSDDGASGGIGSGTKECSSPAACGPLPAMPALACSDGSTGGYTGRCVDLGEGNCVWENRSCPAAGSCFVGTGLDPTLKACATTADCVIVEYAKDCCGNMHAAGVAKADAAKVTACAADRAKSFPTCGCASGPTIADDGTRASASTTAGGGKAVVSCNAAHLCVTTFKTILCGPTPCPSTQTCCNGGPAASTPTCVNAGSACPL